MTPEDRDALRAEAAIHVIARMAGLEGMPPDVSHLDPQDPRRKDVERKENKRRMRRALFAASEADALIAELQVREEFDPTAPPSINDLVREGIAAGGTILLCKHGIPSFEPCGQCDAEDAAGKDGKTGNEGGNPAELPATGNSV